MPNKIRRSLSKKRGHMSGAVVSVVVSFCEVDDSDLVTQAVEMDIWFFQELVWVRRPRLF